MCNLIPFPENSPPVRNSFSCGQSKQAVSLYSTQFQNRMDKSALILNYGQVPILKTRYLDFICHEENPYGVNAIVAIMANSGYNMEDSIIINEGSLKRGLFQTTYMTTYETHEEKSGIGGAKTNKYINPKIQGQKKDFDYSVLDDFGIIPENTVVHDKMILIGISSADPLNKLVEPKDISVVPKKGQMGTVNKTFITDGEEGERIAKVRISDIRIPTFGDKFASRLGQKGVIGMVLREEDMPFTANGIRPDMIINPHAIPTRMTIGQLVECIIGKSCSVLGGYADCTAFSEEGAKFEEFGRALNEIGGFHSSGNEIMFNGMTGEQIDMEIFIGPTYYMRLKHMVKDKINYRERGPMNSLTRQPVGGRANDGGLRIGEMERDVLVSHGITNFLTESMMERGDSYKMPICNVSGSIMALNGAKDICLSPQADGPLEFIQTEDLQNVILKKTGKQKSNNFSIVSVPHTMKLLMQELGALNVGMRLITEKNVPFMDTLRYSDNIYKLKGIENKIDNKETIIKKLLTNTSKQNSIKNSKLLRKSLKGGSNNDDDDEDAKNKEDDDTADEEHYENIIKKQTDINTLMNMIDENGVPEMQMEEYINTYEDNGDNEDKYYDTVDDTDDDIDDSINRNRLIEIDDMELLNVLPYEGEYQPQYEPHYQPQYEQPMINVSPIINIGNEGMTTLPQQQQQQQQLTPQIQPNIQNQNNEFNIMDNNKNNEIIVDKTE
jgi:hypothetical protein